MNVKEFVKASGGRLISGNPEEEIDPSKISTDSRAIKKGEFFVALKGLNYNGDDFALEAFRKGAIGALVSNRAPKFDGWEKIVIKAHDTLKSLQDIAACHRMKFSCPVIAVTGSNGKTTTKEMIWSMLSARYNVLKNEGTRNNHIGVSQTLLKLKAEHQFCVLELGTNHKGEIGSLGRMVRPAMAVMTNIGPSHLEFLCDLEGVYEAKAEILECLDKDSGSVILNGDDPFLAEIKGRGPFKTVSFGLGKTNDFRADILPAANGSVKFLLNGKDEFTLNLLGTHNIYNALAAIAASSGFGISNESMKYALGRCPAPRMRLEVEKAGPIAIINDSYNSNPLSMKYALEAVRDYPANSRWVVSGDMLELGAHAVSLHKKIGEDIARSNVNGLLTFGEFSKYTLSQAGKSGMRKDRLWHCSTHNEIVGILRKFAKEGDVVLLKGSRGMKMEEVIRALKA